MQNQNNLDSTRMVKTAWNIHPLPTRACKKKSGADQRSDATQAKSEETVSCAARTLQVTPNTHEGSESRVYHLQEPPIFLRNMYQKENLPWEALIPKRHFPFDDTTIRVCKIAKRAALMPVTPNVMQKPRRRADRLSSVQREFQDTVVSLEKSIRPRGKPASPRKLLWPVTSTNTTLDCVFGEEPTRPPGKREKGARPSEYEHEFEQDYRVDDRVDNKIKLLPKGSSLAPSIRIIHRPGRLREPCSDEARTVVVKTRTRNSEEPPRVRSILPSPPLHRKPAQLPQPMYREQRQINDPEPIELCPLQDSSPHTDLETRTIYRRSGASDISNKVLLAKRLPPWQIWTCRIVFGSLIILANILLLVIYFLTHRHLYLLAILVFMKSKDLLSTMAGFLWSLFTATRDWMWPPPVVSSKWILSLVCAYAETEDQIMKTVNSLVDQALGTHKQVICIIVDGKDPGVESHFSRITHKLKRSYTTWKGSSNEITIFAGFMRQIPVLLIKKTRNAGKKDSLIMGHDLFNFPRNDMPALAQRLRREIFATVLPALMAGHDFSAFDNVFCTDADSTIHIDALRRLADALGRQKSAIAACGVLVAELAVPRVEWTLWHLYQQFQYTFGQYVRRQAEGSWGRVTCLPGCITMVVVRPEMGSALSKYAMPVTSSNLFEHQVQYLGTDRRLTFCILSQNSRLNSLFVPNALCETVVPEDLEHYLSQRRRWASNAYFNDYYYAFGEQQKIITRLFALIDIVRQSLVFYRVINTALFIRSLALHFYLLKITPTLVLTKTPAAWFMLLVVIREPVLRRRIHKLVIGMCINQIWSPILSVIVFANVLLNMGNQVWGKTGVSSADSRPTHTMYPHPTPDAHLPALAWTPRRLGTTVAKAVHGSSPQDNIEGNKLAAVVDVGGYSQGLLGKESTPKTPEGPAIHDRNLSFSALRRRTPGSVRI